MSLARRCWVQVRRSRQAPAAVPRAGPDASLPQIDRGGTGRAGDDRADRDGPLIGRSWGRPQVSGTCGRVGAVARRSGLRCGWARRIGPPVQGRVRSLRL